MPGGTGISNVDPHNLAAAIAKTNLTEKEGLFVKLTSDGELELCGAGEAGFVLVEGGEEGASCTYVAGAERQSVVVGGAVTPGEALMSNADAQGVVATTGNVIVAIALAAGASGDSIEALTAVPVSKAS